MQQKSYVVCVGVSLIGYWSNVAGTGMSCEVKKHLAAG